MRRFVSLLIFVFLLHNVVRVDAQIDAFSVLSLPSATAAEIKAVTGANSGALAYATDENRIYFYDGSSWNVMVRQSDPNVYSGFFVISGTGALTVSGLPFQPRNITFVAHANVESLNLNSDNGTRNNESGLPNAFGTSNGFARDDSGFVTQQNIYIGSSGNSINDISRFASSSHCVGMRYSSQNGDNLGETTASFTSFTSDGFTINVDSFADGLVVLYTAYN